MHDGDSVHVGGHPEDVAEGDAGVDDVEEGDLDLDGEAGGQAARDEVTELLEVGVAGGHDVHDGHHLKQQELVDTIQKSPHAIVFTCS